MLGKGFKKDPSIGDNEVKDAFINTYTVISNLSIFVLKEAFIKFKIHIYIAIDSIQTENKTKR